MDVAVLQRMLAEDAAAGRMPLVVIADVGTPIAGHVDNIPRLQELCKAHDAWLHLRGNGLASLILPFQHNGHVIIYYFNFGVDKLLICFSLLLATIFG